jgi:glycosyltransferase involved in cell wall biosynthesis
MDEIKNNYYMKKVVYIGGVKHLGVVGGELMKNGIIIRCLKEYGCKVNLVDTSGAHHSVWSAVKVISKLLYYVIFHKNDTFLISTTFSNIYTFVKLLNTIPFNYDIVHWVVGGDLQYKVLDGTYDKKLLAKFRLQIVEAEGMKKILEEECGLHNVIVKSNFKYLQKLPTINKFDDGKTHFMFLSRIRGEKGVSSVIHAVNELNKRDFEDKFVVDFYGNITPSYKKEFDVGLKLNSNLKYAGMIDLKDWSNYDILARYHYMLFPTYWEGEGFPGVVIDAFIAGVPVIISDWNFNSEFVEDGITGKVIPAKDDEKLIEIMQKAINGKLDCEKMSFNCQEKAMKYDTMAVVDKKLIAMIVN